MKNFYILMDIAIVAASTNIICNGLGEAIHQLAYKNYETLFLVLILMLICSIFGSLSLDSIIKFLKKELSN